LNIPGCRMVNSRFGRYTNSSTGRVLAWFTSDSEGWHTPEKASRQTPAACAAATTPVPSVAGSCTNALTWTPLDTRAGTTSPANCPVAPMASTRTHRPRSPKRTISSG
jgi:hypothetical protein